MEKHVYEESSVYLYEKTRKALSLAFRINGFVLSALSAFAFIAFLFVPKENFVTALIIFTILFALTVSAFFFSNRSVVVFDYSIDGNDLKISKVFNGKKRKTVFRSRLFENLSAIRSYDKSKSNKNRKVRFFTENKIAASVNKHLILLDFKSEGNVVIDCTAAFLKEILLRARETVADDAVKKILYRLSEKADNVNENND